MYEELGLQDAFRILCPQCGLKVAIDDTAIVQGVDGQVALKQLLVNFV